MKHHKRIDKLFHKKEDDNVAETIVGIMKYFGWTLEEAMSLPIPSYIEITKIIDKLEKQKDKKKK